MEHYEVLHYIWEKIFFKGGHVMLLFGTHQVVCKDTDLAARELAVLLQGVRNPPPLLVLGSLLCPLLSLRWAGTGEA